MLCSRFIAKAFISFFASLSPGMGPKREFLVVRTIRLNVKSKVVLQLLEVRKSSKANSAYKKGGAMGELPMA